MNILVIKNPYESQLGGGGEKHTLDVMEYLREQGHQVRVVGNCRYLLQMSKDAGFPIEKIDWAGQEAVSEWAIAKFSFTWRRIKKKYRKYLVEQKKNYRINVIYILSWNEKFLLAPIAKELGLKIIFVEHRLIERSIKLNPFRKWYVRGSEYATIIAVSKAVKDSILTLGVSEGRIKVITNGVDAESLDKYRLDFAREGKRIGVVSRLSSEKGLDILLKAFSRLVTKDKELQLEIVGDGPLKHQLQNLADDLNLKNVTWHGYLDSQKDLAEFLSKLDVFALPTRSESFGLALAEAGYLEVPCVSTEIGGVREVIKDNQTGILVEPDNVDVLTKALKQLLESGEKRKSFGQAARVQVHKYFTKDRMLNEMVKVITP